MAIKMSGRDRFALACLFFMTTILFADQMIMTAIVPELSKEFNISEFGVGAIGSAFILVGAIISIIFGYLADKTSRKNLLVFLILIGEIPCILTGVNYFTPNVQSFAALRILSGIGLGGIYPITFSLLADYFKEDRRAAASAWMTVAWGIGALLGVNIAGFLTADYGWRISFILIGIPNIPVVLLYWLFTHEPKRGRAEEALEDLIEQGIVYKQKIKLADLKIIIKNKTNIFTMLQGIPGTVPWGILTFWSVAFFQVYRGTSKEMGTMIFTIIGIANTIGAVFFAYIGEVLYKRNPKFMPLLCGLGILIGIIPAYILFNTPVGTTAGSQIFFYSIAAITGFIVAAPSANVKAILMNVNRPEHRGTVFSVFNITDNLGMGLGPLVGGLLITNLDQMGTMNFAVSWWIPCGIFFLMIMLFITKDRDNLRSLLADRAKEMKTEQKAK